MSTNSFLQNDWCGLNWSTFVPLNDADSIRTLPAAPGVYRVRISGQDRLCYVGQTGRDLRERLRELRRHTLAEEMPFNDPHTAACRLWSYRQADGLEYELSASPVDLPMAERMALECFLIWKYRIEFAASPLCNFGRLHPYYFSSRNRSTGYRGGLLPGDRQKPVGVKSMPPLLPVSMPAATDWMTLHWSPFEQLMQNGPTSISGTSGVYKLLDEQDRLIYVGESADIGNRLRNHRQRAWGVPNVRFSICSLPEAQHASQRLEVENDLIAGHYSTTSKAPLFQFGVKADSSSLER